MEAMLQLDGVNAEQILMPLLPIDDEIGTLGHGIHIASPVHNPVAARETSVSATSV
jgi:hypothetical protein